MTTIDDDLNNADWLSTLRWDFYYGGHLVTTLEEFLIVRGSNDWPLELQKADIRDFLKLPAAKPMPRSLRAEIRVWLGET